MGLKSFISPPIFKENEEKTRQASILHSAGWTIILLLIVVIIGNSLGGKTPPFINFLNFVFMGICFGAIYTLHQGYLTSASLSILLIGTLHLTLAIIRLGTVRTPTTLAYFFVVSIAGLQYGKKGSLLATIVISLILSALIFSERNHLLLQPDFTVGITQWITYTALLGLAGNSTLMAVSISQHYLLQAKQEIQRRKQSEETLRIYSHAIQQNPASIIIADPSGAIESVNPKFLELTGYTETDVIGQNPRILQSGFHDRRFYQELWESISSGKEWHGIFRNRKKNGDLYWEKACISPVFDEEHIITHYVAVKEDITAHKLKEENQAKTNRQLEAQLKEINMLQEELKKQALRDPLTGLHNRRYMDEILTKEFTRAHRENYPVSIILLDLDHLKSLNDIGGHSTGDYALRSLAAQLKACVRQEDTVCRYGGDEFAIILPNTLAKNALERAVQLRHRMEQMTLLHRADQILRISFTAGVATYPTHGKNIEEIFNRADIALYHAKLHGRNRVEIFKEE